MIKALLTTIAVAGLSMSVVAQKDSTAIKIKKDTVKSKETGSLIFNGAMIAFGPQTDSSKTKPKPKTKPDTLKTGSVNSAAASYYAMYSPQTDSIKAKPKAADTVKTGTKYTALNNNAVLAFNPIDGPQTDSSKTKPANIVKPDSTTKPGADKKTGAMYFDRKTGSIMSIPKVTNYYI